MRRPDVFCRRSATITLSDIPVDGVGRSDWLSSYPPHFEGLWLEQSKGLDPPRDRILPDKKLMISAILILSVYRNSTAPSPTTSPLHHSITPPLHYSATPPPRCL